MKEHEKKRTTQDELPAVHKPAKPLGMAGRDPASKAAVVERDELQRLTQRLQHAHDPHERTAILAAIEHRFGSAVADRVLGKLGRRGRGEDPGPPPGTGRHE